MSYNIELSHNVMTKLLFCLLIGLMMTVPFAKDADAQRLLTLDGTGYDSEGEPYTSRYYPIKPLTGQISLVRDPMLEEGQFILEIARGNPVTGCHEISDLGYEATFRGDRLIIETGEFTVDTRNLTQNPHYDCNKSLKSPTAQIVLSREMLEENGTQYIRFTDTVTTNEYALTVTDHFIRMLPDENDVAPAFFFYPKKLPGNRNPLTFWFYPEKTMMLYTPTKPNQKGVEDSIYEWAKVHNLKPLHEIFPDFKNPDQFMFFVDEVGYMNERDGLDRGTQIGEVFAEEIRYTLEEDVPVKVAVPLFAKKPGTYQ